MKVIVDVNKCTGHARCHAVDPELFDVDDSGYALNATVEVPTGSEAVAEVAVASCPERAISIE